MEKIVSFTIDHTRLQKGLYLSRKDVFNGQVISTFDLRFTRPNAEPVMDTSVVHTIEHLGATFFRTKSALKDSIVYFGPMGCRTGFYLILARDILVEDIFDEVKKALEYIINYKGKVVGATPEECGNYTDQNLTGAKKVCIKYFEALELYHITEYPQKEEVEEQAQ